MPNVLYTLIIFPIEQLIELCYAFLFRLTKSPGLSIIGLSIAVSTLILPIYLMAEEKQKAERERQKQMKGKLNKIKAVFKGDEKYMLTSTLYRQHNYHPIYALSNSLDLFIQIPFFIAAYHFLHNLELLNGQKFKFIADLGSPDGLLWGINLFPILMTLINCVSGAIYAKGLQLKDKIQLYGIALVFLILLYNSPAALVLYWTCNNIYNLIKNIVLKNEKLKKLIYPSVILMIYIFVLYILFFSLEIGRYKRFLLAFITGFLILLQYRKQIIERVGKIFITKNIALENTDKTFALSIAGIFLLVGLVIPSTLIASSVEEFSFIKPFSSPLPFIGITLLQSTGIMLWLVCIYFLFTKQTRRAMTFVLTAALGVFAVNVFCFKINYGFMTPDLIFSFFHSVSKIYKIINILVLMFTAAVIILLLLIKNNKILFALQSIIVISLLCFGITNIFKINNSFTKLNAGGTASTSDSFVDIKKYYTFSKTGKNIVLIMLDYGLSGFVPFVFDEKPELLNSFKGFTYYPNTISFGSHTIHGLPGIFGGYYYTPLEIHKRHKESWFDEYRKSLQVLPIILNESNYNVTILNQFWMDYSLYDKYKNISGHNTRYEFLNNFCYQFKNDFLFKNFNKILSGTLLRFSLLKISPYIFHNIIYNDGKYLLFDEFLYDSSYPVNTIDSYALLHYLPNITAISENTFNQFSVLVTDHVCYQAYMEAPDYKPSNNIRFRGNSPLSEEPSFHVMMSSFTLLAKWFDYLKDNGVYDNTRIILVSDHGKRTTNPFKEKNNLPDNRELLEFNCVLMVKDFNADFNLMTDTTFMTNADVPHIATKGIVSPMINPFTKKEMTIEKNNGVTIITNDLWEPDIFNKTNIKSDEWFYVKNNIFEPSNWSRVSIN